MQTSCWGKEGTYEQGDPENATRGDCAKTQERADAFAQNCRLPKYPKYKGGMAELSPKPEIVPRKAAITSASATVPKSAGVRNRVYRITRPKLTALRPKLVAPYTRVPRKNWPPSGGEFPPVAGVSAGSTSGDAMDPLSNIKEVGTIALAVLL
jgi:hypothetical protein